VLPVEEATLEVLGYLLDLGEIQKPDLFVQLLDVFGGMLAISSRLAVEKASPEESTTLYGNIEEMITTFDDTEAHREAWKSFTDNMLSIHKNLVLRLVGNGMRTQFLTNTMNPQNDNPRKVIPAALKTQLKKTAEAVRRRDPDGASDSLIEYVEIVKNTVLSQMTEISSKKEKGIK